MYELLKKIFVVFVTLGLTVSIFGVIYLEGQVIGLKQELAQNPQATFDPFPLTSYVTPMPTSTPSAGFSLTSPKPSATALAPTPQVIYQTQSAKSYTSYIPLGGTFSTTSTDWVDVPNNQITFDLVKDYGSGAKASWEAFLKVDNGNGQAYVRLFDVTHGIAVDGGELSVTNAGAFTNTGSGNLSFWAGRNLYRVQMKSLNGFTVYLDSARIRINN